jgi:hypothetical protein
MDTMAKKKWSDLPTPAKAGIVAAGTVQLALLFAAQVDITRRSADQIRGPKRLWRVIVLVNFLGPLLYFTIGRVRR